MKRNRGKGLFFCNLVGNNGGKGKEIKSTGPSFSIHPNWAEMKRKILEIKIFHVSLLLTFLLNEGIKVESTFFFFCKPNK